MTAGRWRSVGSTVRSLALLVHRQTVRDPHPTPRAEACAWKRRTDDAPGRRIAYWVRGFA